MLTSTQVFAIVNRTIAAQKLSPKAANELRLWASRWLTAFTREREYTYRAVTTMTMNAAAHYSTVR
jgi:hypothetical protein